MSDNLAGVYPRDPRSTSRGIGPVMSKYKFTNVEINFILSPVYAFMNRCIILGRSISEKYQSRDMIFYEQLGGRNLFLRLVFPKYPSQTWHICLIKPNIITIKVHYVESTIYTLFSPDFLKIVFVDLFVCANIDSYCYSGLFCTRGRLISHYLKQFYIISTDWLNIEDNTIKVTFCYLFEFSFICVCAFINYLYLTLYLV